MKMKLIFRKNGLLLVAAAILVIAIVAGASCSSDSGVATTVTSATSSGTTSIVTSVTSGEGATTSEETVIAPSSTSVTSEVSVTQPTIRITDPTDNAALKQGDITVKVDVANFKLVDPNDKANQTNVPGEGHIHYFVDVDAPTTAGQPATVAPGSWAMTADTSYTWSNVTAGEHTFSVELVNNDHTPLSPPQVAKITVNVGA